MGLLDYFKMRDVEDIPATQEDDSMLDPILQAIFENATLTRYDVLNLPEVSACIEKIASVICSLKFKLYKQDGEEIVEVADHRCYLLNNETGDTLTADQMRRAMIEDMYLGKGGYAYVHRIGSEVKSLHYVKDSELSFVSNNDPIFKDYFVEVAGSRYEGWEFIKLLRRTVDGYKSTSVVDDLNRILSVAYNSLIYEENLVKAGGNKKGFLESEKRLTDKAMEHLKDAFKRMYRKNTENVVVLNDGVKFKESSNTSVEMQLNENKLTNGNAFCKIFLIPPTILSGGATEEDRKIFLEDCIMPIVTRFENAVNSVLLTEDEKGTFFFACDTTELVKADIEKRFNAYKLALDAGFMQIDEVRQLEKRPAFGLDFIKLGLQDVLYFPEEKQIYTPNTNQLSVVGDVLKPESAEDNLEEEGGEEE